MYSIYGSILVKMINRPASLFVSRGGAYVSPSVCGLEMESVQKLISKTILNYVLNFLSAFLYYIIKLFILFRI